MNFIEVAGGHGWLYEATFVWSAEAAFRAWMREVLFPIAEGIDANGTPLTGPSLHAHGPGQYALPHSLQFLEEVVPVDGSRCDHHVIFNGEQIGITTNSDVWQPAVNGYANGRRISVRTLQHAHANLWHFFALLGRIHVQHPQWNPLRVLTAALPSLPTRENRYTWAPLIYPVVSPWNV
ncbi:unnamed protein product [Peniophora sp. CBMAI 1063]|nr:unnamed protein product [Peniophora sp. CBMAI 1063]